MANHKRNQLPAGASLINPPIELQIGSWLPMIMDAKCVRHGITWLRVKGGMGGRGDREDWIADLEGVGVSVHDYHWNGEDFGPSYGTFGEAGRMQREG